MALEVPPSQLSEKGDTRVLSKSCHLAEVVENFQFSAFELLLGRSWFSSFQHCQGLVGVNHTFRNQLFGILRTVNAPRTVSLNLANNRASLIGVRLNLSLRGVVKFRRLKLVRDRQQVSRDLSVAFLNGLLPLNDLVVDGLLIFEAHGFWELRLDRAMATECVNEVLVREGRTTASPHQVEIWATVILRDVPTLLVGQLTICLLYTSPSPRDAHESRMPSSA